MGDCLRAGKLSHYMTSYPGQSSRSNFPCVHYIIDECFFLYRYPVILQRFSLNRGSAGEGRYSGGDGVIRELLFRKSLTLSVLSERRVHQPYGLHGIDLLNRRCYQSISQSINQSINQSVLFFREQARNTEIARENRQRKLF